MLDHRNHLGVDDISAALAVQPRLAEPRGADLRSLFEFTEQDRQHLVRHPSLASHDWHWFRFSPSHPAL
jgi:hypothetical protein